jgi:Rrf2 family protein
MLISKSSIYALRSAIYLARQDQNCYVTIKELSDELEISFHFLTKVLQELTKREILKSYQGPHGGVKLAKDAGEITFLDIVQSIDGSHTIADCALGLPDCGELTPCPLHEQWSGLKTSLKTMMEQLSVAELAARHSKQATDSNQTSYSSGQIFLKSIIKTKYT